MRVISGVRLLFAVAWLGGCNGHIVYDSLSDAGASGGRDVSAPRADAGAPRADASIRDSSPVATVDASIGMNHDAGEARDAGSDAVHDGHGQAPHDATKEASGDAARDAAEGHGDTGVDARDDAREAGQRPADASAKDAAKEAGGACFAGEIRCGGACVDLTTSPANCGVCGLSCGALRICKSGECIDPPLTDCTNTCVDTMNDPANCGACGKTCGAGTTCVGGSCGCADMCAGGCVNLRTDKNNCGSCGNVCSVACVDGACSAPLNASSVCGGACVNLWTDPDNCGSCGHACAAGGHCEQQGNCTCPIGWQTCGTTCVDIKNDPNNCGACGTTCTGGQVCNAGSCGCATMCNGVCVDEQTDLDNCGACGVKCSETCTAGVCDQKWCGTGTVVGEYAEWCGKVDVHNGGGTSTVWAADKDCQSGCNQPGVAYCQKFFPSATSFVEIPVDRVLKPFGTQFCNIAYTAQADNQYACCAP